MIAVLTAAISVSWILIGVSGWLGWELLRQNGRMLLRLDELEKRLDELEFGEPGGESRSSRGDEALTSLPQPDDQSLLTSAATSGDGDERANRFGNRSLARSKLKRDGLKRARLRQTFVCQCSMEANWRSRTCAAAASSWFSPIRTAGRAIISRPCWRSSIARPSP